MNLEQCRDRIDTIDDQLIALLEERMEIVHQVGEYKRATGGAIYRPEREKAILERMKSKADRLSDSAVEAIFLEIFAVSRHLELPECIAYLGPQGSFTHQAAESRFGAMGEYLSMNSIAAVFKSVQAGRAKYGVVPIENNTDGVVGETLDLLGASELSVVAEMMLPIHHAFGSKTDHLKSIKRIYSKDIAFGQCRKFLAEYSLEDMERIPVESTAKAARLAAEDPQSAVICSHIAAKIYGLPILFENIEDSHTNKTRFVVISDYKNVPSGQDKTTILAKTANRPGALFSFLKEFNEAGLNLTKIESRPSGEDGGFSSWFYIDFEGHCDDPRVAPILARHEGEIKWLGSYARNC
jgi:chorismate mutase/prephenate dehydratase